MFKIGLCSRFHPSVCNLSQVVHAHCRQVRDRAIQKATVLNSMFEKTTTGQVITSNTSITVEQKVTSKNVAIDAE